MIDRFFDIETSGWDTFVLGGVYDSDGTYASYRDPGELFDDLIDGGGEVGTWNGGLFDTLWFAELARQRAIGCDMATSGTRVTRLRGAGVTIRDMIALIPMRLEKAFGMLEPAQRVELFGGDGTPHKDTGFACVCGACPICGGELRSATLLGGECADHAVCDDCMIDARDHGWTPCGGYCSFSPSMTDAEFETLDAYLYRDCRGGYEICEAVEAEAERCDYTLTGTVGGSAYKTAAGMLGLPKAEWRSGGQYKLARAGYYGGRVQVIRPVAERAHAYDINSAYPGALSRIALPIGDPLECGGTKVRRAYLRGKDGIYRARLRVPEDMFLPPLPWRTPGGRVCYPIGEFSGAWTGLELRYAEQIGCDVDIDAGIIWGDSEIVFKPFTDHVFAMRARHPRGSAFAIWHKFIGNSLTGKLAESPEKDRVVMHPNPDKIRSCGGAAGKGGADCRGRCGYRCCDHQCVRTCGRWNPLDTKGEIWATPFWRLSDCAHVHWAAYLTAATRVQLHEQLIAGPGGDGRDALYCDTDSVYSLAERTRDIGPALGQWGSDGVITDWLAAAPKCYRYTNADGDVVIRAKGLQGIDSADFQRFVDGLAVERDRGVMGLRSAARRGDGLFIRKMLSRSNHADGIHYGDRVLGADGLTYPQTTEQLWQAEAATR